VPSASGSLESYIQTINRFPLLTQEQETDYARRLRDTGDIEAARHLCYHTCGCRIHCARYVGYGLPQADLIQEGNIGLMKASSGSIRNARASRIVRNALDTRRNT